MRSAVEKKGELPWICVKIFEIPIRTVWCPDLRLSILFTRFVDRVVDLFVTTWKIVEKPVLTQRHAPSITENKREWSVYSCNTVTN